MRTPARILSRALTEIEQRAQAHIHTPQKDTMHWIAQRAREAVQDASSAELVREMEAALAEVKRKD